MSRSPIIEHIIRSEVSWRHHSQSAGPKPSVDIQRLEPCSITAFNFGITQATGSVNILNIAGLHEAFDEVLFPPGFETDHVHAHFSAVIAAGEPIPTGVSQGSFVAGPRDPIAFTSKCKMAGFLFPIGTQSGFGQAHSPITSWVHFVAQLISGIGGRGPKSSPIDDGIAIRGLVSVVVLPVLSACILPISVVANISVVVVVSSVSVVLPALPIIKSIISLSRNQGC